MFAGVWGNHLSACFCVCDGQTHAHTYTHTCTRAYKLETEKTLKEKNIPGWKREKQTQRQIKQHLRGGSVLPNPRLGVSLYILCQKGRKIARQRR